MANFLLNLVLRGAGPPRGVTLKPQAPDFLVGHQESPEEAPLGAQPLEEERGSEASAQAEMTPAAALPQADETEMMPLGPPPSPPPGFTFREAARPPLGPPPLQEGRRIEALPVRPLLAQERESPLFQEGERAPPVMSLAERKEWEERRPLPPSPLMTTARKMEARGVAAGGEPRAVAPSPRLLAHPPGEGQDQPGSTQWGPLQGQHEPFEAAPSGPEPPRRAEPGPAPGAWAEPGTLEPWEGAGQVAPRPIEPQETVGWDVRSAAQAASGHEPPGFHAEVRIGRVEVIATPPTAPAAPPGSRGPRGFAAYRRARTYRDRSWY